MKRLVGLVFVFILSFVLLFSFEIDAIQNAVVAFAPFLKGLYQSLGAFFSWAKSLFDSNFVQSVPHWFIDCIVYVITFTIFTIIYYIVFLVITLILKSSRKRKLDKALNGGIISLSEEDKAKFEWKLYQTKFPFWRLFFLLLEIGLIVLFVIVRLDKIFTIENGVTYNDITYFDHIIDINNNTPLTWYYSLAFKLGSIGHFISNVVASYITFMNNIVNTLGLPVIEWVIFGIISALLLAILWAIGSLFAKPYGIFLAKRRAKRAKLKYITKLENTELKAWKKSQTEDRISQKNKDLYNQNDIPDININIDAITENSINNNLNNQTPEQNYIDDISTGVTDLGIIEEDDNELQDPILSRQIHFVGDEEHDIILEEEPLIETIEDEEDYYQDTTILQEETFERYQPEFITSLEIEDKVKKYNIEVIEENAKVEVYEEEVTSLVVDFEDREYQVPVDEDIVIEEIKEENIKKDIKPIELNEDRTKIIDYIVNNTDTTSFALTEDEKEQISVKKPNKPLEINENVNSEEIIEEEIVKPLKPLKPIKKRPKKKIKPIEIKEDK